MLDAVDAVYVCTWTSEHPRLVAAAVERGLPVFCEKPLATTLDAARRPWPTASRPRASSTRSGWCCAAARPSWSSSTRSTTRAAAASKPSCSATTSSCRCRACTDPRGGPIRRRPGRARCSSTRSTTSTRSSGCWDRSVSVSARSSTFHGNPGIEDTVVVGMELASGAQVSLTSVWHQLLERPSLRRLEVICEHAFLTLEHDVVGPVTWTRPGASGFARGRRALQRRRRAPRRPSARTRTPGSSRRSRPAMPGPHPDLRTALRAHVVVDAHLPLRGRGGAAVSVVVRPLNGLRAQAQGWVTRRVSRSLPGSRPGSCGWSGTPISATRSNTSASTSAQDAARGPSTSRLYGAS